MFCIVNRETHVAVASSLDGSTVTFTDEFTANRFLNEFLNRNDFKVSRV